MRRLVAWLAAFTLAGGASGARAWDSFEVQIYDPEVDAPEQVGVELHTNYVPSGIRHAEPPELGHDQVLFETLEPSIGLGHGFELAAYLQMAVRGHEARVDFAGAKVRLKWHAPLDEHSPVQLGANLELSAIPDTYEAGVGGVELRPIVEWREGDFRVSFNPIFSTSVTGDYAGIPSFEPAVGVRYRFFQTVEVSLEYYAASGPITHIAPIRHQLHYLFEVVQIVKWPEWELRAGIGEGLTPDSDSVLITILLGHQF